mgnify:CR=1 FL=1
MSLRENSDRELRKWCVDRVMMSGDSFSLSTLNKAEDLFQYIKFGPDDECDCCDDPDDYGPINTGLGVEILRKSAEPKTRPRYGMFPEDQALTEQLSEQRD